METNTSGIPYNPAAVALTGGTAKFDDGTAPLPSISFTNDATTGFYRPGSGRLSFATGGVTGGLLDQTGILAKSTGSVGFLSTDTVSSASADTVLKRGSAGVFQFGNANSFSANGSVATVLGSVGPVGSHTTVQKWLTIQDNGSTVGYIPIF